MDMAEKKNWFLWRALASLVLIGLLVVGGLAIHYAGWSRGYAAGQLAAEGEEAATPPYLRRAWQPVGYMAYAPGVGLLLKVVLLVVFIAIVGKLMRFVIWGAAWRAAMVGPWASHWHHAYSRRPVPPWWWWYGPPGEEAGEAGAEPDAQS
jgi:uncharacterized membrane protein YjgN (DUF898 family)